jgi:predicted amidohydrolase
MGGRVTVAVAQPRVLPEDVRANALAHAAMVIAANARLVVFPELSLTGYELDAVPVAPEDGALEPIVSACAERESIALVGAPVAGGKGDRHISMLRIDGRGAEVVYHKWFLGGDEVGRFAPGSGPAAIDVDGWRVGLGICKDTGMHEHVAATAALGIDLYVAGVVHHAEELGEQEERAVRIAQACDAHVALASFAGPTGGGYERTAGVSSIWASDGAPIARAGTEPGELARATLVA